MNYGISAAWARTADRNDCGLVKRRLHLSGEITDQLALSALGEITDQLALSALGEITDQLALSAQR